MKSWQTTASGVAAILAVAAKILSGHMPDATDIGVVIAGIGLLRAKQKNVTGGTVQQ